MFYPKVFGRRTVIQVTELPDMLNTTNTEPSVNFMKELRLYGITKQYKVKDTNRPKSHQYDGEPVEADINVKDL